MATIENYSNYKKILKTLTLQKIPTILIINQ